MSGTQLFAAFCLTLVGALFAIPAVDARELTRWHKAGLVIAVLCALPMFVRLWIAAIAG